MKSKPQDFGFNSWIELYHYAKKEVQGRVPDSQVYCQNETQDYAVNDYEYRTRIVKTHKITLKTIERNCWKEVAELIPSPREMEILEYTIYQSRINLDERDNIIKFLKLFM